MRSYCFFLWASLLVDGVFGVEKEEVPVIEGDSVTLKPHVTKILEDDTVEWWFGDIIIAKMKKAFALFFTSDGADGRFKDRLELDHQTGSLTITNIKTTDSGLYKLQINSRDQETFKIFSVTVREGVESVSLMKGDTVTLHTGFIKKQRDELIQWKFKDDVIPTDGLNGWRNLNDQTGDLTIRNIRRDQSGVYELEINTSSLILHRKLHITVTDEMKTASVTEGEPIILLTGLIEIRGYDLILWKFGDHLISEINKSANQVLSHDTSDERFEGRLQPSEQSGSLTISDSRTTDSGVYHLNMSSSSHTVQRTISVTVSGVFGVEKEEVPVSVMEGDFVTLNPSTKIPEDDTILWLFGKESIAVMIKAAERFSTSDGDRVGFKDRLKLDPQTGSLTITNIRTTDSGLYKLQIRSRIKISQNFTVTVRGKKTVPVTEGEPIILHTGVDIQGYDLILWKFGDHLIAEINKSDNQFLSHDTSDERFKDRLLLHQSGDLTINGSKTTDSGDYHLNMSSSSHTIQRTISVTVKSAGLSPGAVAGIVVVVLLLVFAVVIFAGGIYHHRKISERRDLVKNGTNDPLKTGTDGSDNL